MADRLFIEAVVFRANTGLPWRDLPERFGPWKSVYNRFSNWARKKRWEVIFRDLQVEVDQTGSIVDGSVIQTHQDATRYEKTARNYLALGQVSCAWLWLS